MLLSEGQMSDHKSAAASLNVRPTAEEWAAAMTATVFARLWLRAGSPPYILPRKNQKVQHPYCKALFRQCLGDKVKNMFARLVDWPRIAMRYRPCVHFFVSPMVIAAMVIFWIK